MPVKQHNFFSCSKNSIFLCLIIQSGNRCSYIKNEFKIKALEGDGFQLEVCIEINSQDNSIKIKDNAAGIDESNYPRAFRPAERPPDNSGLSEFGMGMKSAACWYSDYWSVRTTAIGESFEKTVVFDMNQIFEDRIEELIIASKPTSPHVHYTIVELAKVHRMPQPKTILKIKNHLTSIYRDFIRRSILVLKFNGEILNYKDPKILQAPYYKNPNDIPKIWRQEIKFPIDENLSVHGFVGILETGATSEAGFALFRRGRVIQGSYDESFRPSLIFQAPNSFRYQRLFGELHLNGFEVSFSKRNFQADENMQIFLELLKDDLKPILDQIDHYRAKVSESDYRHSATSVLKNTVTQIEQNVEEVLTNIRNIPALTTELNQALGYIEKSVHQKFEVFFNDSTWEIVIEMSYDTSINQFYEVGNHLIPNSIIDSSKEVRRVGIRLSLVHPFMKHFVGVDKSRMEPVLKIIAAFGLAETVAKSINATKQGEIRRNFNALISELLVKKISNDYE